MDEPKTTKLAGDFEPNLLEDVARVGRRGGGGDGLGRGCLASEATGGRAAESYETIAVAYVEHRKAFLRRGITCSYVKPSE